MRILNISKVHGNQKTLEANLGSGNYHYIGRVNISRGFVQASPLANPFKRTSVKGATLPEYRKWLWQQIQDGDADVIRELKQIGVSAHPLVCYCDTGCHGEVILQAAKWISEQVSESEEAGDRDDSQVAFVSGHRDIDIAEFVTHYVPRLWDAMDAGHSFVIGDAPGLDTKAREFLSLHISPSQITLFHCGPRPRHKSNGCHVRSGFMSHEAKDSAMTAESDYDIAWVRPGRNTSGTAKNLARRNKSVNPQ